jgi:uncharacterized protein (TIGR00730 family)
VSDITVFMSRHDGKDPLLLLSAQELGCLIAARGHTLRFGAGSLGLMGATARAAINAGGHVVGITTRQLLEQEPPVRGLQDLIVVDTLDERERLLRQGDGFIVLPGSHGTIGEFTRTLMERKLGNHAKPIVLLNIGGFWSRYIEFCRYACGQGIMSPDGIDIVPLADSAAEALGGVETALASAAVPVLAGDGVSLIIVHWQDWPRVIGHPSARSGDFNGALLATQARVVVGQRINSHAHGTWQFPGGTVSSADADFRSAGARELYEETGLRTEPAAFTQCGMTHDYFRPEPPHSPVAKSFRTVFLIARAPRAAQPRLMEPERCAGWRWVPFGEIPQPRTPWFERLCTMGGPRRSATCVATA